jgi:hypothetical protein
MIQNLKRFYRAAHVSSNVIKVSNRFLFDKSKKTFLNLTKVKPNLIIIGSQKCGTTSLHNHLNEHPDIFMSNPYKEPGYFIFDEWAQLYWQKRNVEIKSKKELLLNYMLKGYAGQKYFGESSTYYTQDQREIDFKIPQKIKKEVQSPKLIYIIRNPLERIISVYYHQVKYNNYKGSLNDMLKSDESFLKTSLYSSRLDAYLKEFNKDNLLILRFEDLLEAPQKLMSTIYKFLDLEDYLHEEFKKFNVTSPSEKIKFSKSAYDLVINSFIQDKSDLESSFNIQLDWNLKESQWVS